MDALEIAVLVGVMAAIAWVNWYFFLARRVSAAAAVGRGGVQEIEVVVRSGYSPSEVRVAKGAPVRLTFVREETAGCSEEVVIPEFGIRRFLPAHERTVVEFTPSASGRHEFTCGMGMLRGTIVVE